MDSWGAKREKCSKSLKKNSIPGLGEQ